MARGPSARDRQGGGKGKSRSSKKETGQYGNTRPRDDKSVRRAREVAQSPRIQRAQADAAEHERKLRELEAELAASVAERNREANWALGLAPEPTREARRPEVIEREIDREARAWGYQLIWQGYHLDRVAALTGVPAEELAHLVGRDGYVTEESSSGPWGE